MMKHLLMAVAAVLMPQAAFAACQFGAPSELSRATFPSSATTLGAYFDGAFATDTLKQAVASSGCTEAEVKAEFIRLNGGDPARPLPADATIKVRRLISSGAATPAASMPTAAQPPAPTLSVEVLEARHRDLQLSIKKLEDRPQLTEEESKLLGELKSLSPQLAKKVEEAKVYAEASAKSATAAADSATKAGQSASQARTSADAAKGSAAAAVRSETNAATAANKAQKWAIHSQQWGQHVDAKVTGIGLRSWIGAVTGVAALGLFLFFFFSPHQRIKTWWKWRREEKKLAAVVPQSEAGPSSWQKAA